MESTPAAARPPAPAENPTLIHEEPDAGPRRLPFTDSIAIGREAGDVRIPGDPYLSQQHARVERSGGRFVVRDCDSTNGTFVQVHGALDLRPGDEILLGGQLFRVVV